jgi:hypothetical protein
MRFRTTRLLRALVVTTAVVGLLAHSAGAHGPVGTLGIEVTAGDAPLTARVRVLLEYVNDRDVAPGATVTATATGPDGGTVGPVPLVDRGQGVYDTELTMPSAGTWTVAVTAADPAAVAEATVAVRPANATSDDDDPGATGDPTSSSSADRASGETGSSDDGPGPVVLVGVAVVVVAGAALALLLVRRRSAVSRRGS